MTVGLFVFDLLDDFLYVALGALLYSYSRQWYSSRGDAGRRASHMGNGPTFGLLATALMGPGRPDAGWGGRRRPQRAGRADRALRRVAGGTPGGGGRRRLPARLGWLGGGGRGRDLAGHRAGRGPRLRVGAAGWAGAPAPRA